MIRSIGTKLALKISIALIIVMALFGVWDIFQRREQLRTLLDDKQERVTQQLVLLLGELLYNFSEEQIENAFRSYLADPDILSIKILVDDSVVEYLGVNPETQEILNFADPDSKTPHYEYAEEHQGPIMYLEEELGRVEIVFSQRFIIDQVEDIIRKVSANILLVIIIETIVVLTLARRDISTPLLEVAQAARRIAEGDFEQPIDIRKRDEIGKVAEAFCTMKSTLGQVFQEMDGLTQAVQEGQLHVRGKAEDFAGDWRILIVGLNNVIEAFLSPFHGIADAIDRIAGGNITNTIPDDYAGDFHTITQKLNTMIRTLNEVVMSVQSGANTVAFGSQEMSSSAEQVSQGASEQAASAEEASTSMEQMAATTRQNADNARQTEQIALQSAEDARAGGQAVVEAVQAMQAIAENIAIIEDIALETRLLSLNASIEAAKAQEYGKGFAVVASEVRALAGRSREAAKEINQLAHAGVEIAENAGERLARLVPNIAKTAELVQEISAASHEQSLGAEQINEAIQQLDQVTQHNASTAEETASTAERLASQAEQLQRSMTFFKTDGTAEEAMDAEAGALRGGRTRPARDADPRGTETPDREPAERDGAKTDGTRAGAVMTMSEESGGRDELDAEFERY